MAEKDLSDYLIALKKQRPSVQCLTNSVVRNLTANMLLAVGAIPSMSNDAQEVEDFTRSSHALLVNLGTLDIQQIAAIKIAVAAARQRNIPWILDPVMIHRSSKRAALAQELASLAPTIIRGNQEEMACFDFIPTQTIQVTTGAIDQIKGQGRQCQLSYGHPLMGFVTGMGCAGTAVLAAFAAISEDYFEAAEMGLTLLGKVGEDASQKAKGPASFETAYIDQLYRYYDAGCISAGEHDER